MDDNGETGFATRFTREETPGGYLRSSPLKSASERGALARNWRAPILTSTRARTAGPSPREPTPCCSGRPRPSFTNAPSSSSARSRPAAGRRRTRPRLLRKGEGRLSCASWVRRTRPRLGPEGGGCGNLPWKLCKLDQFRLAHVAIIHASVSCPDHRVCGPDDGRRVADFMVAVLDNERERTETRMKANCVTSSSSSLRCRPRAVAEPALCERIFAPLPRACLPASQLSD
jgi:hypothetical protein